MSQTVIVLEEDCILAANGREGKQPVILKAKRVALPLAGDGFERWQQALSQLGEEWKQEPVRLVLPANLCATRVLTLPYGSGKQLAAMAARELEESFRNEAADYSVLFQEKRGNIDICAGGVEAANLERITEICQEAGILIGSMTIPMEGYLRLLKGLDSYWNRTAIYLLFEEESMVSVLCQNGRYVYSSRSRLFSEPGTLDFGTEIVRSVSGILQFAGNKQNLKITEVYYAGCPEDDFEVSVEGIKSLNLKVYPMEVCSGVSLPDGQKRQDWLPCIGALSFPGRKEKRIDLYRVFKEMSGKDGKHLAVWKHFLVPALTLLVCFVLTVVVAGINLKAEKNIRSQQAWIEDRENQNAYNESLDLQKVLGQLDSSFEELAQMEQNLAGYPEISSSMLQRIERIGGSGMELHIIGFDRETGVLTFDAVSGEVIDLPSYIQSLQDTGLFHELNYTGYTYENEWYTLTLSGILEGNRPQGVSEEALEGGAS